MKKIFKTLSLEMKKESKLEAARGLIGYVEDKLIIMSTGISETQLKELKEN
ncbi:hypothetical protein [Priestia megaterium]|uniref:hypothetical protein n=1 Tax=Priestia megaterium TaxID=1404 RepID=UPI001493F6EE|nr:hypothetical protein [Priestia megaterium]